MNAFRPVIILLALLFFGIATLLPPTTAAQDDAAEERLTLSPAVSKLSLEPGATHEATLKVINDGTVDYTFKVYTAPFSVRNEAYDPDFVTINERTRAFEWVSFKESTHRLAAGEQIDIPYTISVPQNVAPGGHYAVIFAETEPEGQSQITRKKRVGNLLYLTTAGDVQESGRLHEVKTPLFYRSSPIVTDILIENTGNVHFDATATTEYKGLFGRKYLTNNQDAVIMPGTTRRVPMTWEHPPYFGVFKVESKVTYLGSTEELSTKYIILAPMPVRVAIGILVLSLLVLAVVKRKTTPQKKDTEKDDTSTEKS